MKVYVLPTNGNIDTTFCFKYTPLKNIKVDSLKVIYKPSDILIKKIDRVDSNTFKIKFNFLDVGSLEIKDLKIIYYYKDTSEIDSLYSEKVYIYPILVDTNYKSSLLIPKQMEFPVKASAILFLYLLLFFVILTILIKLVKKYFNKTQKEQQDKIDFQKKYPWEKLNELLDMKLWEKGEYKKHCYNLSEIIKEYFSLKHNISLLELTTDEVLKRLKKLETSEIIKELKDLFIELDIYKYTDIVPSNNDIERLNNVALKLVNPENINQNGKKKYEYDKSIN